MAIELYLNGCFLDKWYAEVVLGADQYNSMS